MESRAQEDDRRVETAEKHIAQCAQRLRKAARGLDRVLVERGDEGGRRLVEGALRLSARRSAV
jgi:hypothetical protein